MEEKYLSNHYGATYNSSLAGNSEQPNYPAKRMQTVMNFAMSHGTCGKGSLLYPQDESVKASLTERECKAAPSLLVKLINSMEKVQVNVGESHSYEQCPRFSLATGCDNSSYYDNPADPCIWSWMSMKCDGENFPGETYRALCDSTTDLVYMCDRWRYLFGQSDGSPTYNCRSGVLSAAGWAFG